MPTYTVINPWTGLPYPPGDDSPPDGGDGYDSGTGLPTIGPIQDFFTKYSRYPGNNKQWWVAKASSDDPDHVPPIVAGQFLPENLNKYWAGNNHAPQGHYILQAFYRDRTGVSGVAGLPVEVIDERPNTTCFFSGRIWFGCNTDVMFSQVLSAKVKAGQCYQEADPTSEDISDLVATDGGIIPIPDAGKIVRLLPNAGAVLVFAINGVWAITGTQSGFSALDISVNKVSPIGCKSPLSIVETDNAVYWWSDAGILGVSQQNGSYGPAAGAYQKINISDTTIKGFYNDIPEAAREQCKGIYDAENNTIIWLYRDDDVGQNEYNKILNLSAALNAFYPWKVSNSLGSVNPRIKGVYIAINRNVNDPNDSYVRYPTMIDNSLTFHQFSDPTYVDWGSATYDSYVETGYELFNDAMKKKNLTYIFTYLRRTDTTYDEAMNTTDHPSSCYLQVKFDWASADKSNKWTAPIQIYRNNRLSFDPDTGFSMVISKDKIRGNGRAIQFRFGTDEAGKDFDLHGWSIVATGNTTA